MVAITERASILRSRLSVHGLLLHLSSLLAAPVRYTARSFSAISGKVLLLEAGLPDDILSFVADGFEGVCANAARQVHGGLRVGFLQPAWWADVTVLQANVLGGGSSLTPLHYTPWHPRRLRPLLQVVGGVGW